MPLLGIDPNDPTPRTARELIFGVGPGSVGESRDVLLWPPMLIVAGRFDKAFAALDRGADVIEQTGEGVGFGAEVPTIRARLLLETGSGSAEEVAELLMEALELWSEVTQRDPERDDAPMYLRLVRPRRSPG